MACSPINALHNGPCHHEFYTAFSSFYHGRYKVLYLVQPLMRPPLHNETLLRFSFYTQRRSLIELYLKHIHYPFYSNMNGVQLENSLMFPEVCLSQLSELQQIFAEYNSAHVRILCNNAIVFIVSHDFWIPVEVIFYLYK